MDGWMDGWTEIYDDHGTPKKIGRKTGKICRFRKGESWVVRLEWTKKREKGQG